MDITLFKNPPTLFRPAPFWSWNDHMCAEELTRQIDEMTDKGWGSYFMHARVGLITGYLSDEWMELTRACAEKARETGTYAWLYDEDKWPSGFAGGEVPEMNEAYLSRGLVLLEPHELTESDTVLTEVSHSGKAFCICKKVSKLDNIWFNGTNYVDLMNPEAVQAFIDCTHERYREACGEYFGKEIPGIFTDEPCYFMYKDYPMPALPWSDYLPDFFTRHKGYAITDRLEELFFDTGDYRKVRFDFFDCATRLFLESFTKKYYDWCCKHGMLMTGHYMAEDDMVYQTMWSGAVMPHYQFMHWPGVDKLFRHIGQLVTVKQLTSVTDQLGKERAFCEAFGGAGQQVSFFHRKWITDWQAVLGISFVNCHLSLYSMRGERKRDFPPNLFYQQPWWDNEKGFSDYTGRLSYIASAGKRDVDILIIHSIASVWSEYSPLHKDGGFGAENGEYNAPFEQISKLLMANKLDFHYGDEIIMEDNARVEDGKLYIGGCGYSTVVVPPSCTLRKNTVRLLKAFAEQAGAENLIFVGKNPDRIDGEKADLPFDGDVTRVLSADKLLSTLDSRYADRIKITDMATGKNAPKVWCHIRKSGEGQNILIANTDEKREVTVQIDVKGLSAPKALDMMTGEAYMLPCEQRDGGAARITVTFGPAGSLLITDYALDDVCETLPKFLGSGVVFADKKAALGIIGGWQVRPLEENVLPLGQVTLYLDGKKVLEDQTIEHAWHDHFYKAKNGTPFRAEYRFEVLKVPDSAVTAIIEVAENLDSITFNGTKVTALKQRAERGAFDGSKSWKDPNFTRVPLDGLVREGTNVLVIEGIKVNNITGTGWHERVADYKNHIPTEVETVYIIGDFHVTDINRETFIIDGGKPAAFSADLCDAGYPFYAGKFEYTAKAVYQPKGGQAFIEIGNVDAACLELYVNGQLADVRYWGPYLFDVSGVLREGENDIRIVASTTLFNVMGPNRIADIENELFFTPRSFVDFSRSTKRHMLFPFGLGSAVVCEY